LATLGQLFKKIGLLLTSTSGHTGWNENELDSFDSQYYKTFVESQGDFTAGTL